MRSIKASFYDGKTSQRQDVELYFSPAGQLIVRGLPSERTYALTEVRVAPRIGNTLRSIHLPDGGKCETPDNDAVDAALRRRGKDRWHAFLHTLESHFGYAVLAAMLTVIGVWAVVVHGVPTLAKHAAFAMPPAIDAKLGSETLAIMDRTMFKRSQLSAQQQRELRSRFRTMTQKLADGHEFQLEFRRGARIGANAFALPSGIVVLTDELVELAGHQQELLAVLAHEVGHVTHRHALRALLQNSAVVLLIVSITGDVTSISALSAALPTMLVEAKYSRDFEREADRFTLQYLRTHRIPATRFADILRRLEKRRPSTSGVHDYLATHPATEERIKLFTAESRERPA